MVGETGSVAANGGIFHFVVAVTIPSNVQPPPPPNVTDTTTVTVTSASDPSVTASVSDQTLVAYIVPFQDSLYTIQATAFAPCARLYIGGFNLVPQSDYGLIYADPSGNPVQTVSPIKADGAGTFGDYYVFPADALTGTWTVTLSDNSGVVMNIISVTLQRSASITVQPSPLSAPLSGGPLVASTLMTDNNAGVAYSGTRVNYTVKDLAGMQYLQPGGSWSGSGFAATHQPFGVLAGASTGDTLSIASVTYPSYGIYTVCATWETSCGSDTASADDLASSCSNFYVVSWGTFADPSFLTSQTGFALSDAVYLHGQGYGDGSTYKVVLYGPTGNTLLSQNSGSNALSLTLASGTLSTTGDYHAVVYPSGITPPAAYNASDPNIIAVAAFTALDNPPPADDPPVVNSPILANPASITGTTSPATADGTTITIYSNGVELGTTTVTSGQWTYTGPGLTGLSGGESITATAGNSAPSLPVVVIPLAALLRVQWKTLTISGTLSPPDQATVFPNKSSDPSLPTLTAQQVAPEVAQFASGASFSHAATDATDTTVQVVYYQLQGNTSSTLLVKKSLVNGSNVVVITYN